VTRPYDIRLDDDNMLDEVVVRKPRFVHLERLDRGLWWLGITMQDGTVLHVDLSARRPQQTIIEGVVEVEGP
jgi:hypothetical protein